MKTIPGTFKQFTDHSIDHKDQVMTNYELFLTPSIVKALNPFEIYFLICATYLHDIGMSKLSDLGDLNIKDDSKGIEDYIREKHHRRTEDYINRFYLNLAIEDHHQARIIGNICRGHRKEDLSLRQDFKKEDGYNNFIINVAFLSLCLKLADELDLTHTRTPQLLYDVLDISDKKSMDEWKSHLSISSVHRSIENTQDIICVGQTNSPNIYRKITLMKTKIDDVLKLMPSMLDARLNKFEKYIPVNFKVDVSPVDFTPKDFKFSLANDQIIDLLYRYLYKNKIVALRELLKNSIDSVNRARQQNGDIAPSIKFNLSNDKEILEIIDNGVGMNDGDIENFLTKLGSSYYQSSEFKTNFNFSPLSELGIGFLSTFMIAQKIEIETCKLNSPPIHIEIENKLDYFIVRKGNMEIPGMKLSLYLVEDMKNEELIEKGLKYFASHLDIPIQFNYLNRNISIRDNGYFLNKRLLDKDKYFHVDLNDDDAEGVIFFALEKNADNWAPMKRFSNKIPLVHRKYPRISFKGIRIDDFTVVPTHYSYVFVDINIKNPNLKLNAARDSFIENEEFIQIKKKIDRKVISNFEEIFNSLWNFELEKKYCYTKLFFSNYIEIFNIGKHNLEGESIDIIKEFFLNYNIFMSSINGEFVYATARQIIKKKCVIIKYNGEPEEYIRELVNNSSAFSTDKNYVFIDFHLIHFDIELENKSRSYDIIVDVFGSDLTEIKDLIKYLELDTFKGLDLFLDKWVLVRFTNYNSNKLIEEFNIGSVLINSNHRFIKLLMNCVKHIENNDDLKTKIQLFFRSFNVMRYGKTVEKVLPYQKDILNWMEKHSLIDSIESFLLSECDIVSESDDYYVSI